MYSNQIIQSSHEFVIIKKTFVTKKSSFEKIKKEKDIYFYHKFPLENIYDVSESMVKKMNFKIETSSKDGVITKLKEPEQSELRDHFDKSIWYAPTNQIFHFANHPPESIMILEGTTKLVPINILPHPTIQKSYFTYFYISN